MKVFGRKKHEVNDDIDNGLGDFADTADDDGGSVESGSAEDEQPVEQAEKGKAEAIANRETKVVFGMRVLVLLVLVACTVLLSYFVHDYLSTAEIDEFHEEFVSDATKVLQTFGLSLDQTLGALDAFAVATVSHARDTNQSWPFVTVPDFAIRATKTKRLAKAAYVALYTFVKGNQRSEWQNYTELEGIDWVNQSVILQSQDPHYYGPNYFDFYTVDYIHDYDEEPMPEGNLYMPIWQNAP